MKNFTVAFAGNPNVGKSTLINRLARKNIAKTGDRPGVTTAQQWVKVGKELELLDTPGILWPKFEDQQVGLHLALIGSIKDDIINIEELAYELVGFLKKEYPEILQERYGFLPMENDYEVLKQIAQVRHCLLKGGDWNTEKASTILLDDFRSGKLGRLSMEAAPKL